MGFQENKRVSLVLVLFMISSLWGTSEADPRTDVARQLCNTTYDYDNCKTFIAGLNNLSTLVSQNGFGISISGEGPNAVYAFAQCFKDLNPIDCKLCSSQIRSVLPKCYPNTGGRIFLDGCFGRYANFSFFDQAEDSEDSKVCSLNKTSSVPGKFYETVKAVIKKVSTEAQSGGGFAVGSVSSSNLTVNALAQCWETLDKKVCNSCLQDAASSVISCSPAIEGRSLKAGCYMRYSTEVFWNLNQTVSQSSGKNNMYFWIIPCSVFGGFLLLTGTGIWIAKHYSRKSSNDSVRDLYGPALSTAISQSKLNYRYQDLRKATKNFDTSNKLGQGSYGTVYKGVLSNGRKVAVKRLLLNTSEWVNQFFNEVNLINRVRHKSLVKLLGCSVDGPESLLVYEYYFNKSLDQFIFDATKAKHLDWQKRFEIIQGVAEGISYLHEESEIRIIHRDIKASNVLLDDKLKPKITDFGLARSFVEDQTHITTGIAGTIGYMAPEYIVHGHLTEKADVYSFGVLIQEIVTGQRCSTGVGSQAGQFFLSTIWDHYKAKTVHEIIDKSFYDVGVKDHILHVVNVGLICTQATPSHRPTMSKVVELLRNCRDYDELYPSDPPFLDMLVMRGNNEEYEESNLLNMASRV